MSFPWINRNIFLAYQDVVLDSRHTYVHPFQTLWREAPTQSCLCSLSSPLIPVMIRNPSIPRSVSTSQTCEEQLFFQCFTRYIENVNVSKGNYHNNSRHFMQTLWLVRKKIITSNIYCLISPSAAINYRKFQNSPLKFCHSLY